MGWLLQKLERYCINKSSHHLCGIEGKPCYPFDQNGTNIPNSWTSNGNHCDSVECSGSCFYGWEKYMNTWKKGLVRFVNPTYFVQRGYRLVSLQSVSWLKSHTNCYNLNLNLREIQKLYGSDLYLTYSISRSILNNFKN